jgi:hypothetical protein
LAFAALIGLVALASGLSGMRFENPQQVGFENFLRLSDPASTSTPPEASWMRYLIAGMFILLFILMLGPMRPQTGKNLIMQLLRFSAVAFVLMLIMSRIAEKNPLFMNEDETASAPGAGDAPQSFSAPEVSTQWEFWITAAIILVIGVIAIVVFNRLVDRWFQQRKPLDEFADIARSALNELSTKKESRNAIIRCYTRMNAAVGQYRGITREAAMTPAEFADRLESAGLPRDHVRGLTRIFERVRYGGQTVGPQEIKEARNCLTGILKACEAQR